MSKARKPVIGILALQGAVMPHQPHIEAASGQSVLVKTAAQLQDIDGLIIPGGESTTMLNLIERFNLWDALVDTFDRIPVWGICAGAILMAETIKNPAQKSFSVLPVTATRNGYGRQLQSHHAVVSDYPVSFIRAPVLSDTGACDVLATYEDVPVWLAYKNHMVTTFHPELTADYPSPMHRYFIEPLGKNA